MRAEQRAERRSTAPRQHDGTEEEAAAGAQLRGGLAEGQAYQSLSQGGCGGYGLADTRRQRESQGGAEQGPAVTLSRVGRALCSAPRTSSCAVVCCCTVEKARWGGSVAGLLCVMLARVAGGKFSSKEPATDSLAQRFALLCEYRMIAQKRWNSDHRIVRRWNRYRPTIIGFYHVSVVIV